MLTIYIGAKKEIIESVDSRRGRVYPLFVVENGTLDYLQNRLSCTEVEKVELRLLFRLIPRFSLRLRLPPALQQSILYFLRTYHAKQDLAFDCYAFACHVKGIADAPKGVYGHWKPVRRILPQSGDTVFLLQSEEGSRFHHAAIYIGWGLYVSVWGAGGDLEVATLKDMQRCFGAKKVIFVDPRAGATVR